VADGTLVSISIAYCFECGDMPLAVREAELLLREYEHRLTQLTLIPSVNSVFDVAVDRQLVFSRTKLGRNPTSGELIRVVGEKLGL
jgi:predicted Rdx family selenoprotein